MFKNTYIFFLIDLLNKISAFLILPILTKSLTVSEYGSYSLVMPISIAIVVISSLGFDSTYSRFSFDVSINQKALFHTFFTITTSFVIVFSLIAMFFMIKTNTFNFVESLYISIISLLVSIVAFPRTYFITKKDSTKFAIYSITQLILWLSGVLLLWKFDEISVNNILIVLCFSYLSSTLVAYYLFNNLVPIFTSFNFKKLHIITTQSYRVPMYGVTLVTFGYMYIDKFLVMGLLNAESLGIYAIAISVASVIRSVGVSMQFSIMPDFYNYLDLEDYISINKSIKILIFASIPLYIIFQLLVSVIWPLVIDVKFNEALSLLPMLSIVFVIDIFSLININFLTHKKESNRIFKIESLVLTIQFLTYSLTLYYFNLQELILSMFLISLLKLIIILNIVDRKYNIPVPFLYYILLFVVLTSLAYFYPNVLNFIKS